MNYLLCLAVAIVNFFPVSADSAPIEPAAFSHPIRVACIGDSITAGSGASPGHSYPAQLQKLLGENWLVQNFGVSARTLLRKGDLPYWNEKSFTNAINSNPNVVIILLGANDSKPQNWIHNDEFATDYNDLVKTFLSLPSKPAVYVCRPTPVTEAGNYGINEAGVQKEISIINRIAEDYNLGIIDMHAALADKARFLPDRVHPNNEGAGEMAKTAYRMLTGKEPDAGLDQENVNADVNQLLDACNISWSVPGPTSAESMPIGNGDIGLNVWTETNGDIAFYIGKADAWGDNVMSPTALMKLGEVRLSLSPSPMNSTTAFQQVLRLRDGEIQIKEGSKTNAILFRIWVDANHPVIRTEVSGSGPLPTMAVKLINWRLPSKNSSNPDVIVPNQTNNITWYHRNGPKSDPHLAGITFGAVIKGDNFVSTDSTTLESLVSTNVRSFSVFPYTATTPTPEQWLEQLNHGIVQMELLSLEQTRVEHKKWWDQFWHRSWIFVQGGHDASNVTQGYILQRFVTACAGRGSYPIKFNGSIFVVDDPAKPNGKDTNGIPKAPSYVNADYRIWGGQYWFQNTRAMYWPRLEAGDFDMMLPLFNMYAKMLPNNAAQIKQYYKHDGAYFAETAPFWGGLKYWGPEVQENWTGHYFTPILELSMMMLDYYEYTGDRNFAETTLLPVATAGLQFFDQHFERGKDGKILLDPDNAIEMYWKVHNPAPDIAGLQAILTRMIVLPDDLVSNSLRKSWERMLKELPELPSGLRSGKKSLLPYTGEQTVKSRNGENPELYAVYPFRIFGLGKPDLQLALDTFSSRKCTQKGCWVQDPIQAAMLGLPDVAKDYVLYNFTRTDPRLKFPAFWAKSNDYAPDEDNGGNGENGLQKMIMQTDGKKILLLPAWPKEWDVSFKLNAPLQTTVQGTVCNGKLIDLVVSPPERKSDVIDLSHPQSPK